MSCIHRRASAHDTIQIFFCERISFIWKRKSIPSSPLPSLFNKKIEGKRKKKKWGCFKIRSRILVWKIQLFFSPAFRKKRENEETSSFSFPPPFLKKRMKKEEGKNAIFSVSFSNKKEKWKREEMNSLFRSPFQKRKIEREKKDEN